MAQRAAGSAVPAFRARVHFVSRRGGGGPGEGSTPFVCCSQKGCAYRDDRSRFEARVVRRRRAPVLELLAREDEALLVRRDALLVLDLCEGRRG